MSCLISKSYTENYSESNMVNMIFGVKIKICESPQAKSSAWSHQSYAVLCFRRISGNLYESFIWLSEYIYTHICVCSYECEKQTGYIHYNLGNFIFIYLLL